MSDETNGFGLFSRPPGRPDDESRALHLKRANALDAKDSTEAATARERARTLGPYSQGARTEAMREARKHDAAVRDADR